MLVTQFLLLLLTSIFAFTGGLNFYSYWWSQILLLLVTSIFCFYWWPQFLLLLGTLSCVALYTEVIELCGMMAALSRVGCAWRKITMQVCILFVMEPVTISVKMALQSRHGPPSRPTTPNGYRALAYSDAWVVVNDY